MDIIAVIQKQYLGFSNKEKIIADYVLKEGKQLENINISVLAKRIGVSDGTITRFCKKIGCSTFTDFKIRLGALQTEQQKNEDSDPLTHVYDFYKQVIERTNKMMNRKELEHIANEIQKARFIYSYGIGSTGLSANEFMLRLMRMGFQGQSITDSHSMIINSSVVSQEDLVIAFSASGETSEVVNAAAIARKNGCRVLCITSFSDSSLAQNADYSFTVPNSVLVDREQFFNSQFPFMYVIDLLTTIFLENKEIKEKISITVETIIEQSRVKSDTK